MIFKRNIVKIIDKYPGLMRSLAILIFFKDIKKICSEILDELKLVKIVEVHCISFQNGQIHFKNFTANFARFFKAYLTIMHHRVNKY